MTDLNYFTCTLGQAVLLRKQTGHDTRSYRTVLELVDEQARRFPATPAVGFADYCNAEAPSQLPHQLTFSELYDLSGAAAARLHNVLRIPDSTEESVTVGLLCTSSVEFVLTWLGLMRLGHKSFLLAPQLEPEAILHLCHASEVGMILVDDAQEHRTTPVREQVNVVRIPAYSTNSSTSDEARRGDGTNNCDVAYLRHTSGTSSGMPKPIVQSQWGAVGCLPAFPTKDQVATFSTTPLYHGGLADCFRAWTSGAMIWFFPEGVLPITGANVTRAVSYARETSPAAVKYFSSVPYVLQMLAEDNEGVNLLQTMDLVGVGGAALAAPIGDKLVDRQVNLVSRMGSAECGFLMSSHRNYSDDREWQYLRPIDDPSFISFEPREGGLSELIVKPGWPLRSKLNRDDGSYATSDLFEPHRSIPNAWRYHSRADAQITLANGKKFDPSPSEGAIRASTPLLRDVLIFGAGREYAGALLFRATNDISDDNLLEYVWPLVDQLNAGAQSHARLAKPMLVFVQPKEDAPLPKSSKGTTLRRQAEERYADVIEGAYSHKGESMGAFQLVSDENVDFTLMMEFSKIMGRGVELDPEQDLYQQGVDSMACIQMLKFIEVILLPRGAPPLPMNFIYDMGSISKLTEELLRIRQGASPRSALHDDSELTVMKEMAEKYSGFVPLSSEFDDKDGEVVTLTGATGALGAHILSELCNDSRVSQVYCLLRGQSPLAARERVSKALKKRNLLGPADLNGDGLPDKVTCLPCNLADSKLGLRYDDWESVLAESTTFIHAAWAVNFTLRLPSFENQISGTRNLLNAAFLSGARCFFISSTAAVSASPSGSIPEKASEEPADASPLGYSRSKWIAEHVCTAAHHHSIESLSKAEADNSRVSIIRVGQLCGNETGVWNASEAYPLMLSTAKLTGCLPDLQNESLNWLPVHLAAKAVLEIALPRPTPGGTAQLDRASSPEIPVYHVLNPHKSPSWRTMLDWISQIPGDTPFSVVSPAEWIKRLDMLEGSISEHPSQALLGLWKQRFASEANGPNRNGLPQESATKQPAFEVVAAKRLSQTQRGIKPLDREAVIRMWEWIWESC